MLQQLPCTTRRHPSNEQDNERPTSSTSLRPKLADLNNMHSEPWCRYFTNQTSMKSIKDIKALTVLKLLIDSSDASSTVDQGSSSHTHLPRISVIEVLVVFCGIHGRCCTLLMLARCRPLVLWLLLQIIISLFLGSPILRFLIANATIFLSSRSEIESDHQWRMKVTVRPLQYKFLW